MYSVKVSNGDLLLMGGWFQREFLHSLGAHTDPLALHTGSGTTMSPPWLRPSSTLPGGLARLRPVYNASRSLQHRGACYHHHHGHHSARAPARKANFMSRDLYCMHPSLELLFDVHLRLRDGLHALVGLMQGFQEVLRSL